MSYYSDYQEANYFSSPRITWAVQQLIFINIAVFVVQLVLGTGMAFFFPEAARGMIPGGILNEWFGFQPARFLFSFWLWTPLTYMFLHSGVLHIFMNMLWLFFFGCDVERTLGSRQFIRFYLLCGAAGVMATLVAAVLRDELHPVIGASGATMGVLVAFAMIDPERQFFLFPLPFPINARALVLIVVFLNIITALGENQVSVATHFGGMIVGFVYMKFAPDVNRWITRQRGARAKTKPPKIDKVGEAVDNIFNFEDRRK